jgi:non-specific serine/threonine protein kinase
VTRLLSPRAGAARLLTLTGAGGCGKSRLTLEIAREVSPEFADGVYFAKLAPVGDPGLVLSTVARILNVRETVDKPLTSVLANRLATEHVLLVLDNCEHLIGGCAALAETLLRACPHLQILATSREALGIRSEVPWRVPSLDVSPEHEATTPEQLLHYDAARLFVDRARSAWSDVAPTARNGPAITFQLPSPGWHPSYDRDGGGTDDRVVG